MNTIPESFDEYRERIVSEAKKPAKGTPEWHEHRIAVDTVRNPNKALLGGPSAEEAEDKLRKKFGYSDAEIEALKEGLGISEAEDKGAKKTEMEKLAVDYLSSGPQASKAEISRFLKTDAGRKFVEYIAAQWGGRGSSGREDVYDAWMKLDKGDRAKLFEQTVSEAKLSWGASEADYRELYRLGRMTKPSDKEGETLADYEALRDRMFGNDKSGRGWRDGMPPDVADAMKRAKSADEFVRMLSRSVHEASGRAATRSFVAAEMDENFQGVKYAFDPDEPSVMVITHKAHGLSTRNDLASLAKEVCDHFASKGCKVAFDRGDHSVTFHDMAEGVDEGSVFWSKEPLKWLTALDHKVGNLATTLLWLRGWHPSEERFAGDRARIEKTIEGMKAAAAEIDDMVEEIGDYLKQTLDSMSNYRARDARN